MKFDKTRNFGYNFGRSVSAAAAVEAKAVIYRWCENMLYAVAEALCSNPPAFVQIPQDTLKPFSLFLEVSPKVDGRNLRRSWSEVSDGANDGPSAPTKSPKLSFSPPLHASHKNSLRPPHFPGVFK